METTFESCFGKASSPSRVRKLFFFFPSPEKVSEETENSEAHGSTPRQLHVRIKDEREAAIADAPYPRKVLPKLLLGGGVAGAKAARGA